MQRYREQADYVRAFRFSEEGAREEAGYAGEIGAWVGERLTAEGWPLPS